MCEMLHNHRKHRTKRREEQNAALTEGCDTVQTTTGNAAAREMLAQTPCPGPGLGEALGHTKA